MHQMHHTAVEAPEGVGLPSPTSSGSKGIGGFLNDSCGVGEVYTEILDQRGHFHHCCLDVERRGHHTPPTEIHHHLLGLLGVEDEVFVFALACQVFYLTPVH